MPESKKSALNALTAAARVRLKLLALKAIPEIERRAVEWLAENKGAVFGDKREAALEYMCEQYKRSTASIPGLKDTDLDDKVFRQYAEQYLDWAWEQLGELVNDAARLPAPSTTASELPAGGVK